MNFDRRHRPSNRRENDNKWTDRSDNRSGDNFGKRIRDFNSGNDNRMMSNFNDFDNKRHNRNFERSDDGKRENFDDFLYQRRDKHIGSGFPVRENSFDNPVCSLDQNYGNDFQKREHFNEITDRGREKRFGSDFRMRDNCNDNVNQSHGRKFENDYQERERINEFSDQGCGKNFGSDFRMHENSNDNVNQIHNRKFDTDYQKSFNEFNDQGHEGNFGNDNRMEEARINNRGNDNRMKDSSRDFNNTGRDHILRSDDRIHDFNSHGRVNDLGSYKRMRKSCNDRTRESVNFRNQGRGNNFPSDDRMPESCNKFGYGNRDNNFRSIQIPGAQIPNKQVDFYQRSEDITLLKSDSIVSSTVGSNIRQNTFDDQVGYVNIDSNKTRGNDDMFKNYLQGTKIQNIKRSNENYLSPKPEISGENTSSNYPKLQEGSKDFVFSNLSNEPIRKLNTKENMQEQSIIRPQEEADKNKPEIINEKTESDLVLTTPCTTDNIKIKNLREGLKDIIAVELTDKRGMTKCARRKLNKQTWRAKTKQIEELQSEIARNHIKVCPDKKREMESKEEPDEVQSKSKNLCLIIKDYGQKGKEIPKSRRAQFENAMSNKIEKYGAPRPTFTFGAFIDGVFRLTCADEFSYEWVRANVPLLKLWKGANLKVTCDMMKEIRNIPASPKPSLDFEPISEKDLIADLVNRNNCRGNIDIIKQLKVKQAISGLIPRGSHLPYNFTRTGEKSLSIECNDLTSLQWLYDHLSVLDGLWLNADLRLIQRRTLLYFRKITFTLKQKVSTPIEALMCLVRENKTLHTGLWRPLRLHANRRTVSFAIEEESVKDLEALGSRIKYIGDTIDVQIHPRGESQAKRNIGSPSVIQEIDNYELKQTGIAGISGAEENASTDGDDN